MRKRTVAIVTGAIAATAKRLNEPQNQRIVIR